MTFDDAFDRLIGHEGGHVNNPADPGGETMFGVTARVARANGYTGPMKDIPRGTAKTIAKTAYWDRVQGDVLPPAVAFQVFDAAYNHGIETAVRFLQRAVGVADDGHFGPVSLKALQAMSVTDVLARFNAERLDFYTRLSTWDTFGRGWARRIVGNLRYAAQDA
jgi:lysozyme family protein